MNEEIQQAINEAIKNHEHQGTSAKRVQGKNLIKAPQAAISNVSVSAGATYTATEQSILNDHGAKINLIITALENLGLIQS